MIILDKAASRLSQWVDEFTTDSPERIDKTYVHRTRDENVFVSRFERVDEEHPDHFIAQLYLPSTHSFFFEHPLDHYPGLMLIEAGRQLGTAIAHLAYEVPVEGRVFILDTVRVDFSSFAEIGRPVFLTVETSEKKYRAGVLTEMFCSGEFIQNDRCIGTMKVRWHMYPRQVIERLRRAAQRSSG